MYVWDWQLSVLCKGHNFGMPTRSQCAVPMPLSPSFSLCLSLPLILAGPIDTSSPAATLTAADFYRLDKLHGESINTRAVAKAVDKAVLTGKPQGLDAAGAIRFKSDVVAAACATLSRAKTRAEEAEARGRPIRRVDLSFLKRLTLKHSSHVLNSSLVGKEGRTTHKVRVAWWTS